MLEQWRERWADCQNRVLERAGLDARVDHRTLEAQGIDREPEPKLGPVATEMERDGRSSHAGDDLRAVWQRNADRALLADRSDLIAYQIEQQRLEAAQAAREAFERARTDYAADRQLFAAQRAAMAQERDNYQRQIDTLAAQLEGRGRFAVFWDKLRGRLGWRAEDDLRAARLALQQTQERQAALEVAAALQERRAREEAVQRHQVEQRRADQQRTPDRQRGPPQAPKTTQEYNRMSGGAAAEAPKRQQEARRQEKIGRRDQPPDSMTAQEQRAAQMRADFTSSSRPRSPERPTGETAQERKRREMREGLEEARRQQRDQPERER